MKPPGPARTFSAQILAGHLLLVIEHPAGRSPWSCPSIPDMGSAVEGDDFSAAEGVAVCRSSRKSAGPQEREWPSGEGVLHPVNHRSGASRTSWSRALTLFGGSLRGATPIFYQSQAGSFIQ